MISRLLCSSLALALVVQPFYSEQVYCADPVKITITLVELDDSGERPAAGVYVVADPRFSTDKSKRTDSSGSVTFELPPTESVAIKVGSPTRNEKVMTISGRFDQRLSHLIIKRTVPYTVSVDLSYDATLMETRTFTYTAPKLIGDDNEIGEIREFLYDQLNHAGGRLMSGERREQIIAMKPRIFAATQVDNDTPQATRESMLRSRAELLAAHDRLLETPYKLGIAFSDTLNVGAVVDEVLPGGAAERANLQIGEIITHVDGVIVHRSGLAYLIANAKQANVTLRIKGTDGVSRSVEVQLIR